MIKILLYLLILFFVVINQSLAMDVDETEKTKYLAIMMNDEELEKFLQSSDDLEMPSKDGFTSMFGVALVRDSKTLKKWIQAGANVNATTNLGSTPLFFAALSNIRGNIKVLIEAGANINHRKKNGDNVLHFTLERPDTIRTEFAIELVKLGADVNALNAKGQSPLNLLRGRKHYKWSRDEETLEKLLIKNGARDISGFMVKDKTENNGNTQYGKSKTSPKMKVFSDSQTEYNCSTISRNGKGRFRSNSVDNENCNGQDDLNQPR